MFVGGRGMISAKVTRKRARGVVARSYAFAQRREGCYRFSVVEIRIRFEYCLQILAERERRGEGRIPEGRGHPGQKNVRCVKGLAVASNITIVIINGMSNSIRNKNI